MIEYIYFVKCPNCDDEPFDFFDEAQHYALGCLSNKPIITQVEVDRDDFGCCTDSRDLGTIWSYDNIMDSDLSAAEPAEPMLFSKSETFGLSDDELFSEFDDEEFTIENDDDIEISIEDDEDDEDEDVEINIIDDDDDEDVVITIEDDENTSIDVKSLVEMMEENEDTVECKWCEDLFDKSECRYEVNLGYLCSRCEAAIKSRGETLTFKENNYWDFLDDDTDELAEDIQLTEGKYDFHKLYYAEDAKKTILTELDINPKTCTFVRANQFSVPFIEVSRGSTSFGTAKTGILNDFEIRKDGRIIVSGNRNGKPGQWDLALLIKLLAKGSPAHEFFVTLTEIATKINKETRISSVRDVVAKTELNKNIAYELAHHITSIVYSIPDAPDDIVTSDTLLDYAPKNDLTATESLAEEIANKLNSMYDNFEAWIQKFPNPTSAKARLVKYRPVFVKKDEKLVINDASLKNLGAWAPEATIKLDCNYGSLSEPTQNFIAYVKAFTIQKGNYAPKSKSDMLGDNAIESIRVARTLSNYFNDLLFFEKDLELTPDSDATDGEEVIEVDFRKGEPATV